MNNKATITWNNLKELVDKEFDIFMEETERQIPMIWKFLGYYGDSWLDYNYEYW